MKGDGWVEGLVVGYSSCEKFVPLKIGIRSAIVRCAWQKFVRFGVHGAQIFGVG